MTAAGERDYTQQLLEVFPVARIRGRANTGDGVIWVVNTSGR